MKKSKYILLIKIITCLMLTITITFCLSMANYLCQTNITLAAQPTTTPTPTSGP